MPKKLLLPQTKVLLEKALKTRPITEEEQRVLTDLMDKYRPVLQDMCQADGESDVEVIVRMNVDKGWYVPFGQYKVSISVKETSQKNYSSDFGFGMGHSIESSFLDSVKSVAGSVQRDAFQFSKIWK